MHSNSKCSTLFAITDNPIFAGLNDKQLEAVNALKGPVLILAGAGSGKTRALTHRIANLIANGVPPWQILAVTFTNKAAKEMSGRITNLLNITMTPPSPQRALSTVDIGDAKTKATGERGAGGVRAQLPVMGTFHSVCVRILRRDIEQIGRNRNFVIYDTSDQQTLIKHILIDMKLDPKQMKPRTVLSYIGGWKSDALSISDIKAGATTEKAEKIVQIYERYQYRLKEANALDFDDLLLETVRLFKECPDVLKRYQNTWQYINVDEYQDTNRTQYLIISLLAKEHKNLCVIGDPDQSIYAFRGADIRNILDFQHEYPDSKSIKLEQNYRSTQQILDASDEVISQNPGRPQKKMWTHRVDGNLITLHEVSDEKREAEEAIKSVMEQMAQGIPLNEQVVLYRTNAQSRLFEETCMKEAVPYRLVGGTKFYARKEVKDILAYLHVIQNPEDTLSLLRIINVPARKIGKTTIERLREYCQQQQQSLWSTLREIENITSINEPTQNRLKAFADIILKYRMKQETMTVAQLAEELIKELDFEHWLRDDTTEGETRWENIGELMNVMHKYDALDPAQSLISFLEEVALISEVDKMNELQEEALTLMTLHLCKGLEFQHVIIAGCEEGIFPHSAAQFDRAQLEEERRIMYVGMTRAKDHLKLFCARSRTLWGSVQANEPSRFLNDIPEKLIERKSDELLSGFGWPSGSKTSGINFEAIYNNPNPNIKPKPQRTTPITQNSNFNQDTELDNDFNQDAGDIEIGCRVRHGVFGEGTIRDLKGDVAEIAFDSGQTKKIALSVARVEVM